MPTTKEIEVDFPASPKGGKVKVTVTIPDAVVTVPPPRINQDLPLIVQPPVTYVAVATPTPEPPPVVVPPPVVIPGIRKNLILNVDFSKGLMPATSILNAQPPGRFLIKTLANGKKYCEVTVAESDPVIPATSTGTNRSEFNIPTAQAEQFKEGQVRKYGVRINLPKSFIADAAMECLFQLHEFSGSASPHFALWTWKGHWWIAIDGQGDFDMGAYDFDKDTDFVFDIKWSITTVGMIAVYKDGVKVKSYPGKNMPADVKLPYLKTGIYKWSWRKGPASNPSSIISRTINIGAVYIGNELASLADVTP